MIEPTIRTDKYDLYLGDCLDVMREMEAGSVDAVNGGALQIITACGRIGCEGECNHERSTVSEQTQETGIGYSLDGAQARDRMAISRSNVVAGEDGQLLPSITGGVIQGDEEAGNIVAREGEYWQTEREIQDRGRKHHVSPNDNQGQMRGLWENKETGCPSQERRSPRQSFGEPAGTLRILSQQPNEKAVVGQAKIDWIITDPPYGLNYRGNTWDANIPDWFDSARSITTNIIFTTAPTTQWDYPRPDWVCDWHRRAAASRSSSGGFNHWSPILVYGKAKFSVDYYETMFGKTINENAGIDHPSPKPLELYLWILEQATNLGDTILDPFMGSGTTGVACMQLGQRFVGVEIDPGYFDIAAKRIAQAARQEPLFTL